MGVPARSVVAVSVLLTLGGCTQPGTPLPSSTTVTPTLSWSTPAADATPTTTRPRPSGRAPRPPSRSVTVLPDRVGGVVLGRTSPAEARESLATALGAPSSAPSCEGAATVLSWGALQITFAGRPAVARQWQVEPEAGTAGLRLPRGTEWRPEREALLDRADATTSTSGDDLVVTLADGFTYRLGSTDQRARTIGGGTPACG